MNSDIPDTVKPIRSDSLSGIGNVRHGFFTREGGLSTGIYSGLNVGRGSDDDPALVAANRGRVAAALGLAGQPLSTPHQVHSPDVITISEPFSEDARPKADAVVTATPGVIVGVLTADCGPLLFADKSGKIVACAHAGWKGALGGVAEAAIDKMVELGARRDGIAAVLGPTISKAAYEVGPEFMDRFVSADSANADFFTDSERNGHAMFDLPGYITRRMEKAGIASFTDLGFCTYAEEEHFFSYRRAAHRGEPDYGRLIAAISPA